MSERHHWGSDPDDDELDGGPTEQTAELPDEVLTDADIDDGAPTQSHHLSAPKRPPLPSYESTGTITLPRGFLASAPELPRLPPPTPFRVVMRPLPGPPPKPLPRGDSSFSLAPTPVRRLPSRPAPPPVRRAKSQPPPPPMRPSRAPPARPSQQPPARASQPPPAPDRPRPPLASAPPRNEATRPFPLQNPLGQSASPRPATIEVELDPRLAVLQAPTPIIALAAPLPPEPPVTRLVVSPSFTPTAPASHLSAPSPELRPMQPRPAEPPPPVFPSTPPPVFPSAPPPSALLTARLRAIPAAPRSFLAKTPALRAASMGVLAAVLVSVLVTLVVIMVRSFGPDREPGNPVIAARPLAQPAKPRAEPAAEPSPAPAGGFAGCTLARTLQRLTSSALPSVFPMGAPAPGLDRVALGYASSKGRAEGVIVDLDDLSVETRLSEDLGRTVYRVTPLADRSPVTFAVDGDYPNVQAARTIASNPPLRVGVSFFGFVRINENTEPTVIWSGGRYDAVTEPVFATTERDGHGVVFRSGRASGDVLAGWLTPSGTADGDLARIDAGAREVGTPAIATNDKTVLVVFPARGQGEVWKLLAASSPRGKAPRGSRLLDAGSGSADAMAPAIAALPNGGWLVQWLEISGGTRRVMVRAFGRELEPVGLPLEISSGAGIQDTPGALVVRAGRVLAVHLSATERSVGLWAAVLRCG